MRTEFLCISVLRVASGPRVKLASCKSALNPPVVCSTDRSKAVVPVLVLLFVALWFIRRGDLLYVFPCDFFFLCFSVLLVLRLPRLGKRELILVFFVRLFGLCLFRFVGFLFLLGSGKGCGLRLCYSLDFSLTFFVSRPWKTIIMAASGNSDLLAYNHLIVDAVQVVQQFAEASNCQGLDCSLEFCSQRSQVSQRNIKVNETRTNISYIYEGSLVVLSFHIILVLLVS